MNREKLDVIEVVKNLGLTAECYSRFRQHMARVTGASFGKLKIHYSSRNSLTAKLRKTLCESPILSRFNYYDFFYGPCFDSEDNRRTPKIQNACLRLIYGIRKRDHISHTLAWAGWLNMIIRRKLHLECFWDDLILFGVPPKGVLFPFIGCPCAIFCAILLLK